MAYEDRLRTAEYRSPSGATYVLQFDDLDRSGGKKVAIHEYPQQNNADIQDLGNSIDKFPLSIYFTGPDYDKAADGFRAALEESGAGTLKHPRWGDFSALPVAWTQSEKFVDDLGRASFKVDFVRAGAVRAGLPQSGPGVFPTSQVSAEESIGALAAEVDATSAIEAAEAFDPENAADVLACQELAQGFADATEEQMQVILADDLDLKKQFNDAMRSVESAIDNFVAAPLKVFNDVANFAKLPAQIVSKILGKVEAYRSLIVATLLSIPRTYSQAITQAQALFYALGGAAVASTIGTLASRSEAVAAAASLEEASTAVAEGLEAIEASVEGFRAQPETVAQLQEAITTARASLLERAYDLKVERRIVLDVERTPLDLVAELYGGEIDELDNFIETNGLRGDEILLIPAGREVVYYAE